MTRRRFLALAAAGSAGARALVSSAFAAPAAVRVAGGSPLREFRRSAAPTKIDFGPLGRRTVWTYDGEFPGREIRVREGDRLRVVVKNELPEPTTVPVKPVEV